MLKPYYGCCRFTRILPVTYTDSISPYDQMCKIQDKINEVIEALNNINVDFENYVNQKINELKTYVDSENQKQTILLENEINEVDGKLSTFIETTYAEFVTETGQKFTEVYEEISKRIFEVYTYIDNADNSIKQLIAVEIEKLKKYVDESILGKILIFNPTTGYKESIDKVVNDIYDTLRYWGVTALEFDDYGITCTSFDNMDLSAIKFDVYGREWFGKYYPHYIFDFENGSYDRIQDVLYRFVQTTRPLSIEAGAFDGKDKDATTLDGYAFTAYTFDSTASQIIS